MIGIDTNIILNVLKDGESKEHVSGSTQLFRFFIGQKITIVISAITVTELFRKPFREKSEFEKSKVDEFLHYIGVSIIPVQRDAAVEAARYMEELGMEMADALIAASLKFAGVKTFVTRNVLDYKNADLEILTPEQFLKKNK